MKKQKIQIILGIIMLPFLFAIFILDRFIGSILFWMPLPSAKQYFDTMNHFVTSLYRIGTVGIGFLIYYLVKWIF